MKKGNRLHHVVSMLIFSLAIIYCGMVYYSGNVSDANAGLHFLIGMPNYYFFYLVVFPFVSAAIAYLAIYNKSIRFFGTLEGKESHKIIKLRKTLLIISVVFSVFIAVSDASDRGRAIPPYGLSVETENGYNEVINKYMEIKQSYRESLQQAGPDTENTGHEGNKFSDDYLNVLEEYGYKGHSAISFGSLSSWYSNSSFLYKFENVLSWIAALIISILFSQIFLAAKIKNSVDEHTKNIILWALILSSFWIPCKTISVYYYSLIDAQLPVIIWFAIVLLIIAVGMYLFLQLEGNNMVKYSAIIAAAASSLSTVISIFRPEYYQSAFEVISSLSGVYGFILLFLFGFSVYLITESLISSDENSTASSTDKNYTL